MTLDEKLDHFYSSVIENATRQNIEIVEEYKKTLQKNYDEHKEAALRKAEANLKIASDQIIRERNRRLSAETMEFRRKILERSADITDEIFTEVREKLEEYMKTPAYEDLLCTQIRNAIDFAKGDSMIIYINPSDAGKIKHLQQKTGASLTISNRDFIGGCRAVIMSDNILIDDSFITKLEEAKDSFTL